jgi:hypothetical protein
MLGGLAASGGVCPCAEPVKKKMNINSIGRRARRMGTDPGTPSPLFFVNIDSKGFRFSVSLLESVFTDNL